MADAPCVVVQRRNPALSCCGIILDIANGIVLTVASLFGDILPLNNTARRRWVDASDHRFAVEVTIESNRCCQEFRTLRGFAFFFWRDEALNRLEQQIFPSSEWKFESIDLGQIRELQSSVNKDFTDARYIRNQQNAMSDFVLIRVQELGSYQSCTAVDLVTLRNSRRPEKGDTVWIIGTPFGSECPSVFYNSIAKGIISNVVGGEREVIITDARCVPGCEGCLLYISSQVQNSFDQSGPGRLPYAIVLVPFCWRNGEWTGITIACSLKFLRNSLLKIMGISMSQLPHHLGEFGLDIWNSNSVVPYHIDNSYRQVKDRYDVSPVVFSGAHAFSGVVLVQHGFSWGSGIVVDAEEGLVATCSHVICSVVSGENTLQHHTPHGEQLKVSVDFPNGAWQDAQVIYASKKDCPLDFALLKIDRCPVQQVLQWRGSGREELANSLYKNGEEVFVMGFPLFASHLKIGPSIASGVLSKVVYCDNLVVMLQASAAVQCGISGGALVSSETGKLLGMITSHVRDSELISTFPHISFSIPYTLLHKLVLAIKSNSIEECMMSLVSNQMKNIWQLRSSIDEHNRVASKL